MQEIDSDIRLDDLPEVFREVAELIGLLLALALVRWRGGTAINIPERPRPGQKLVKVIGLEAAQKLAARFGRTRLNIPTPHRLSSRARNRRIRAEYDDQPNVLRLVQKYSLSERSIRTILKQAG